MPRLPRRAHPGQDTTDYSFMFKCLREIIKKAAEILLYAVAGFALGLIFVFTPPLVLFVLVLAIGLIAMLSSQESQHSNTYPRRGYLYPNPVGMSFFVPADSDDFGDDDPIVHKPGTTVAAPRPQGTTTEHST
jgi:hypothetical protein